MPSRLLQSARHLLFLVLGGLTMLLIVLLCAFLTLRLAIHGREVAVPNLSGKSDADAAAAAKDHGLNLTIENRFYSPAIAPNHILSQSPVAGSRVRRGWQIRVTESLGAQVVSIPDVTGQAERPASLVLRRLQLDLGTVAHLPAPSPEGIVLAQSPPPNSKAINAPSVALLVSDAESEASVPAFVMPSILGLSLAAAYTRVAAAGLHIATTQSADTDPAKEPTDSSAAGYIAPQPLTGAATVIGQSPAPGHRVTRTDAIRVTLSN